MKRILLLLFTIIAINDSFAQKIIYDDISISGERQIRTKYMKRRIEKVDYFFSIKAFEMSGKASFYLIIQAYSRLDNHNIVLLKLNNEEVLTFVAQNVNNKEFQSTYSIPSYITSTTGYIISETKELSTALYELQIEDILKIKEFGIKKTRIEKTSKNGYVDKVWADNALGRYIQRSYDKIENILNSKPKSPKSIVDDF